MGPRQLHQGWTDPTADELLRRSLWSSQWSWTQRPSRRRCDQRPVRSLGKMWGGEHQKMLCHNMGSQKLMVWRSQRFHIERQPTPSFFWGFKDSLGWKKSWESVFHRIAHTHTTKSYPLPERAKFLDATRQLRRWKLRVYLLVTLRSSIVVDLELGEFVITFHNLLFIQLLVQPPWKICSSNWITSPSKGENTNIWNHYL